MLTMTIGAPEREREECHVPTGDDGAESVVPGYRNYVIYTDESGVHGAKYYGFGTLWVPWERRGDLQGQLRELRDRHRLSDELKWTKISRRAEAFVRDVVEWFFVRPWMMFHCIVVPCEDVDWDCHSSRDNAQQKHFSMLLKNKVARFAKSGGKVYRVRVDPLPWRYTKANEVVQKIVNAQLKTEFGEPLIHDILACDSKRTPGIQVVDLLLGAVIGAWQQDAISEPKLRTMQWIAHHLGWPELRHDTYNTEWKFNVWHFHAPPTGGPRKASTIAVHLKHLMPPHRLSTPPRLARSAPGSSIHPNSATSSRHFKR
jgi:hypothetical protein